MRRFLLAATASLLVSSCAYAQTSLSAGDLAVVGVNTDDNDLVSIVTLRNLSANTQFGFFDYGILADQSIRFGGEGWVSFVTNQAYAAGTVFTFQRASNAWTSAQDGTITFDSLAATPAVADASLSTDGDQVIVYQGAINDADALGNPANSFTGSLLFAYNGDNTSTGPDGWSPNTTTAQASARPSAVGEAYIGLFPNGSQEFDNARYNGPTTGTADFLLTAITNRTNWAFSNTRIANNVFPSSFTVVPVPEVGTLGLLGLGALPLAGAIAARRRKGA